MGKELSPEANVAIDNRVKQVANEQLAELFENLEKKLIEDMKENLSDYLTTNKYRLEEERVKNYRKRMRNTVKLILEKYKEFSDFVENFEKPKKKLEISSKKVKQMINQISLFDLFGEDDNTKLNSDFFTEQVIYNKKIKSNILTEEEIQKAKLLKKLFDNAFQSYKEKALKKLDIKPVISTKEFDYETIEANELDTKKLKRKLILLQKVYIEGKKLEEINSFDEVEYIGSKNYQNDVNSLVDDLMILIFGYEGLNYIILERFGFEL